MGIGKRTTGLSLVAGAALLLGLGFTFLGDALLTTVGVVLTIAGLVSYIFIVKSFLDAPGSPAGE